MSEPESLVVYSDYICPFCYLGHESLRQYESTRDGELTVEWQPFDLRSRKRGPDGEIDDSVDDGKDEAYYEQARENVRRLQSEYGVEMELDLATDTDSLPAQLASYYVQAQYPARWRAFDEAIFEALWVEGQDISDPAVLETIANSVGLDGGEICGQLQDSELRNDLFDEFGAAQEQGITGVPTFVYDGYAARGAVPPEQLERLLEGP